METGLISSRYTTSLLNYAIELGQQEEVYARMKILSQMFLQVPKLRSAILNPSLSAQEKKKIILAACGGTPPSSLDKMISLIIKNERQESIQHIALRYIDLYREKFHIHHGKLITAVSINNEIQDRLIARIEKIIGGEIELEAVVDPQIMGGFVLHMGDYRWDASVLGELTRIRNKFNIYK
jgi:ATP synthase, F1 delta subunit